MMTTRYPLRRPSKSHPPPSIISNSSKEEFLDYNASRGRNEPGATLFETRHASHEPTHQDRWDGLQKQSKTKRKFQHDSDSAVGERSTSSPFLALSRNNIIPPLEVLSAKTKFTPLWNESNASQKHEISDSKSQFKEKAPIQFRNSLSGERGESKSSRNLLDQILDEPLTVLSRGRDRSVDDYEDYTARGMPFEPLTPPQHQINIGAEPAYIANEDTGLYTAISESAVAPRMSYEEEKVHQEKSRQIPGLSEPDQQGLLDSPTPNATMQQHGLPRVGLNFDLDQMPPGIPDTPSIPQRLTEVAYEQHHPPLYMRYTISQDMTAEAEPLQISKLSAIKDRHMCLKDRAALLEIFSNRSSKSRTTEETLPTRETPLTLSGGDYRKANLARQIRTPTDRVNVNQHHLSPLNYGHPTEWSFQSSVEDITLSCYFNNCDVNFTGEYRKGNLVRHIRTQHGNAGNPNKFICEALGCGKIFKRKVAWLKHHRTYHPEMNLSPVLTRREYSASKTISSGNYVPRPRIPTALYSTHIPLRVPYRFEYEAKWYNPIKDF